jgi:uncharacterized protein (TIGR02594 family)
MATAILASIRNNNPGAQYPGPSSRRFGALKTNTIGGGHLIAQFPDKVSGAAALFDLLLRLYVGLSLKDALTKWSGGKGVESYIALVSKRTGLKSTDKLSRTYLGDPAKAITFAKAIARQEAGEEYPMTEPEWLEAYALATGNLKPSEREIPTPWLEIAISKIGLAEIHGKKQHNAQIVRMFALCGHPEITDDETAWCAVFVGSCLIEAKYPASDRKGATMARSFLRYGVPVKPKDVRPGDLRIEKRPEGGPDAGHVEFVVEVNGDRVKTVAGNVSNRVKYDDKPLQGANLLGYRRPILGDKPVIVAAKESPSVTMLLGSAFMAFCAWVYSWWSWLLDLGGYLIGAVPDVAGHVGTSVGATRMAVEQAGLAIPSKILIAMAIMSASLAIVRLIQQRR